MLEFCHALVDGLAACLRFNEATTARSWNSTAGMVGGKESADCFNEATTARSWNSLERRCTNARAPLASMRPRPRGRGIGGLAPPYYLARSSTSNRRAEVRDFS